MLLSSTKSRQGYGTWKPRSTSKEKMIVMYKRLISTFYPVIFIVLLYYFLYEYQPSFIQSLHYSQSDGHLSQGLSKAVVSHDLPVVSAPTMPLPLSRKAGAAAVRSSKKNRQLKLWQDMEYAGDTTSPGGVVGYTVFRNLYLSNGTFFAVTSDESSFPAVSTFLSQSPSGPATEEFFRVIDPETARNLFGKRVQRLNGDSIFFADSSPDSLLAHYYHFVVECFSGAWKALVSLSDKPIDEMETPRRIIIAREGQWRDGPKLNPWFLNVVLPDTVFEDEAMWLDRARSGQVYVFEQVVIVDRWAAHRHSSEVNKWNKMNAEVYDLEGPMDWWEPLRRSLMQSLQIEEEKVPEKPVITYINRQGDTKRMLNPGSHDALVIALMEIQSEGLADVYDARMEKMSKQEQFALASRTNIMIGVHGNGLSHLVWMPRGSDVIEIFAPTGFTRDYQIITPALGHDHHAIWNDTVETEESWRAKGRANFPEDFHGHTIPVSGPFIKDLIKDVISKKYSKKVSPPASDQLLMEIH